MSLDEDNMSIDSYNSNETINFDNDNQNDFDNDDFI